MDKITEYYILALLEGEGIGTAYEYYAKSKVIKKVIEKDKIKNILIAGLPEKYGSSLDFIFLANHLNAEVLVIDDRECALNALRSYIDELKLDLNIKYQLVDFINIDHKEYSKFDTVLNCEVLQRYDEQTKTKIINSLTEMTDKLLLFAPNKGNNSHAVLSGLKAISINELKDKIPADKSHFCKFGFVDMPPFPPGIQLSDEKRKNIKKAWWQSIALKILEIYCDYFERFLPKIIKSKFAHIIYVVYLPEEN